jgi:hypothetical protein
MTAGTLDSSVSTVSRLRLEDRGSVAPFPARAKHTYLSAPELETDSGTRPFSCYCKPWTFSQRVKLQMYFCLVPMMAKTERCSQSFRIRDVTRRRWRFKSSGTAVCRRDDWQIFYTVIADVSNELFDSVFIMCTVQEQ